MNLDDLKKRVDLEKEGRKMFIFRDKNGGWSNVDLEVTQHEIVITLADNSIFSSDK